MGEDPSYRTQPGTAATPAVPKARRAIFHISALAGGNLVSTILRIAGGILLARMVAPAVLGLFNGLGLVQGYLRFMQLGVLNGLGRELPYFVGRGDTRRAGELAATAQAWAIGCGSLVAAALGGFAVWHLAQGDFWMAAGWATIAVTAFLYFYSDMYLQTTYRTSSDFARLSMANVVQNTLALLMVIPVVWLSFYGLCLRAVATALAGLWLLRMWRPIRVSPDFRLAHLRHLLFVGLPIFLVGEMANWWKLLEGTWVYMHLGTVGMGLYAMALVPTSATDLIPTAIGQVIYPRMAERYGRRHDVRELLRMTHLPTLACAAAMLPAVIAGWFLADPLTTWVTPKYVGAIDAMKWGLVASYVWSFSMVHNIFNVARRQDLYGIVVGLGIATYFVALQYLLQDGAALEDFPKAMIVGRGVYAVLGYLGVLLILRGEKVDS